jgi:hypothetical protein
VHLPNERFVSRGTILNRELVKNSALARLFWNLRIRFLRPRYSPVKRALGQRRQPAKTMDATIVEIP